MKSGARFLLTNLSKDFEVKIAKEKYFILLLWHTIKCTYLTISILTLQEDIDHWQTVFYIAAAVYGVGNLLFCIMASGEEQPWNQIQDDENEDATNVEAPTVPAQNLGPIIPSTSQDLIGDEGYWNLIINYAMIIYNPPKQNETIKVETLQYFNKLWM